MELQTKRLDAAEQQRLIDRELHLYQARLARIDPDWPADIRNLGAYIHQHLFDESLTVAAVKQACRVRDNNVSGRFAHYAGLGIKEYINAHRMEIATALLRRDEMKIVQIAHSVGYPSHGTFTRAFQRYHGCSPSAFQVRVSEKRQEKRKEKGQEKGKEKV